jgi:hypothetical protein
LPRCSQWTQRGRGGRRRNRGRAPVPAGRRLGRTAGGTLALWLACLLPFVGWVLLFGYVAFLGLGGFVLSYFARPVTPAPAALE